MLQQTQVDRVIPYYLKFMTSFPTLQALAKAEKEILLGHWSGLGYNNRVLRLQECAKLLTKQERTIPSSEEQLVTLPGIGPYTARAVVAFACNKEVPVIDTNIRRIFIHEFKLDEKISLKEMEDIAKICIPKGKSCIWHNALMDYGALILTAKKTKIKSLSQQSKFVGSDRYLRGQVIKLLIEKKEITLQEIKAKFKYPNTKEILYKMQQDNLIEINKNIIKIKK